METYTTAVIRTGAMMQRMVRVIAIPPNSRIGARIPMVWLDWIKLCRL